MRARTSSSMALCWSLEFVVVVDVSVIAKDSVDLESSGGSVVPIYLNYKITCRVFFHSLFNLVLP